MSHSEYRSIHPFVRKVTKLYSKCSQNQILFLNQIVLCIRHELSVHNLGYIFQFDLVIDSLEVLRLLSVNEIDSLLLGKQEMHGD